MTIFMTAVMRRSRGSCMEQTRMFSQDIHNNIIRIVNVYI